MLCFWSAPAPRGSRPFLCSERAKGQQTLGLQCIEHDIDHAEETEPPEPHTCISPDVIIPAKPSSLPSGQGNEIIQERLAADAQHNPELTHCTCCGDCPRHLPWALWLLNLMFTSRKATRKVLLWCRDLKDGRDFRGSVMWSLSSGSLVGKKPMDTHLFSVIKTYLNVTFHSAWLSYFIL